MKRENSIGREGDRSEEDYTPYLDTEAGQDAATKIHATYQEKLDEINASMHNVESDGSISIIRRRLLLEELEKEKKLIEKDKEAALVDRGLKRAS